MSKREGKILERKLSESHKVYAKKPFGLAGISPFNSYFSEDKILEICEWMSINYEDFAFFIPDQLSKYTFEALGYDESRTNRKVKKQDNYTINKTKRALSRFYDAHPSSNKIKIYLISELQENANFQDFYKKYSEMFKRDKIFYQGCLTTSNWVLSGSKSKTDVIELAQKDIAAKYFLYELPAMTNATTILGVESCDFVYHTIPAFLKELYLESTLVSRAQSFLILK